MNCRNRRIKNQHQLEKDNVMLTQKCQKLHAIVNDLRQRLSFYEPGLIYQQLEDDAFTPLKVEIIKQSKSRI